MLVTEFSYYINLALWYLKLLVCLSFPVIWYVIRRKWEIAVAKEVEIRRLIRLAAEEEARAEAEAAEAGYYADVSVNRAAFGFRGDAEVEEGSAGCLSEVAMHDEVVLSNVEAHKCAVCWSPSTARCSRCKSVWYCSTKCQIFDWREGHKDKCYPRVLTQTSNEETSNQENKVTLADPVETQDRQLYRCSMHSKENVFWAIGPTESLNGNKDGINAKILEELKPSISTASLSTPFSSNSSSSSTTSYSSDDASIIETSGSSDLEKTVGCQHDDTSNRAKSVTQLDNEIKQFDPNGSITAPSKLKTPPMSTQHDNQKTSRRSPSLSVGSCDPLVAKPGPPAFCEGVLGQGWSNTKPHARNDCSSNIGPSLSRTSGLSGKIDSSCHVNGNIHGSYSVINEPSNDIVSCKKTESSSEVGIPVQSSSNIPKQAKCVDDSVLKKSGDNDSNHSSSAAVLPPPGGKDQGDAQKVSICPLSFTKKGNCTVSDINHISNQRRSSVGNGDEIVHSVKGDNSCQANDVFHSQSVKPSSLFAEQLGCGLNSSECTEQLLKPKVVESLHSSSHGKHAYEVASCVTNVDMVKSNINVATCDKSYSLKVGNSSKNPTWKTVDHFQASKPSRRRAADEKDANKGGFSYELFKSLYRWNKIELQPCGLVNCGNSCYANAVLQCLTFTPPLTAYILEGLHSRSCTKKDWCFTCEFEHLMRKSKEGKSPISPIGIISQIQNIGSHLSNGREEDAHEFLRYVVDTMQNICLEEAIGKMSGYVEEETTLLSLTFGGYLQSKIRCLKCGNKSKRSERIMDLSVEIEGSIGSLEDALKRFTSSETLDGENKYNCGRCKSYQKARKKLTISEAPNILTIALKRFQSGEFGKLSKWIDFPQILNMAPYMSGTSDDKAPVYELYGVIVHLDTMNASFSGHYVCYVKNNQKKWFKIDDGVVKISNFGEVKKQSAYMLFYARCLPRAPRYLRDKLISDSRPKATPGPKSPDFNSLINSKAYSNRHSVKFETDLYSDRNSLFGSSSDRNSCSTDISTRESNKSDDLSDLVCGGSGYGLRYPWNSSSNSESSSPSIFPL